MKTVLPSPLENASQLISSIYGQDVFNLKTMRNYLSKDVYKKLLATIRKGHKLDPDIADDVAVAMKQWALEKGASHYTHWFQPLNGSTAGKHDSFVEVDNEGNLELSFSGKNLVQGEPDASSFPSGGLRATFEARGYTAWDPTSPAFIKRTGHGATLCIPTAFCSYKGEALDKKTPLLRSMKAVALQTQRLLACFGESPDIRVTPDLGAEQEYFLVDKKLFSKRPDLMMCGRTLFGTIPPKHQQMEDHYFAAIEDRVLEFMVDVDEALWKLGIPAKTRHNEVAPCQFEIAPIFESLNLAVDHNMLLMEVLRRTANKHGLVCLLHEKPFDGVNGSGKHNNWSLGAPGFGSLFNPGKSPHENAIFLTLLCCIIMAVDKHADILLASVAKAGNEHRLGANEAPPAIISIYLGDLLDEIIKQIENGGSGSARKKGVMNIGVDSLPDLPLDTSDRNRTSPFAFTGNKFEFRAVGSSQTCAWPMTVLNTIMAEALDEVTTILEPVAGKPEFHEVLQKTLRNIIKRHKRILFSGDGYCKEWVKEAERRGLYNRPGALEALAALEEEKAVSLFDKYQVMSPSELHARYEVQMEIYLKELCIETETAILMAETMYMPAVAKQLSELADTIVRLKKAGLTAGLNTAIERASRIGELYDSIPGWVQSLREARKAKDTDAMKFGMSALRKAIDSLEIITDSQLWPVPTYSELLFLQR
ncbi:glutamine synthetase III [Akkermansia sp. N21169]|jgi:glutamine synthetase|uniref:glutamine synthetase III family protein n=1 Tax=unclassified Akkermansia TaxID=2608915 RepID=UPI00244EEB6E|nr:MULTISPECIES: glutamine synthetase III [unclassified Akkermansia]MDH3068683.1 glutamine synthetase III [Akkermansia sp. N21169]WPX39666.1 glutamine synthetase III [Akkermansia sp. N21116]